MLPIHIFWPIGIGLGLALLSALEETTAAPRRKSIEVCTAQIAVTWMKEDGVVRVYHEVVAMSCARIVVELAPGAAPPPVPGEIEGYPVLVRMQSPGANFGADESGPKGAMAKLLSRLQRYGFGLQVYPGGTLGGLAKYSPATSQYTAMILQGQLSDRDKAYLNYLADTYEVTYKVRSGEGRTEISFLPKRYGRPLLSTF